MDSSPTVTSLGKKKGLSAEGVAGGIKTTPSPNSPTGSKKQSSLVHHKKKVGQSTASRCENPHGMYFICKHGHPIFRTLHCHARFEIDCPHCARQWRRNAIKRFSERIRRMEFPAMVDFTLKKPMNRALEELNCLVQRCRKYVRRKGYKIRACVSCLEPPNHIHCVWDCSYIPQKTLSDLWRTITRDSFIVYIQKVDRQRWRKPVYYISKYITKICRCGSSVKMRGVHVINSWGYCGYYKRMRMVCKICGSYFEPLWYAGAVDEFENDDVDFVEIDNDYG